MISARVPLAPPSALHYHSSPTMRRKRRMPGRVEGKVALIVGAGCVGPGWGNGRAAAVLFAREGAKVFAVDKDADSMTETVARVGNDGEIATHICDVLDDAQVAAMTEACRRPIRPHRHPPQQCRRLGGGRRRRNVGGGLRQADRLQSQERVSCPAVTSFRSWSSRAAAPSSTPRRAPASVSPARRRSATPRPRPR